MRISLVLLFSFLSFISAAQTEDTGGSAVYFKLGGNASNLIKWDDNEPTETLIGPAGGMGVWIRLGKPVRKTLALVIEGNFSAQGFKLDQDNETHKVRTTYFNAALLLRQYFGHFYFTAGGERGFLMTTKIITETDRVDAPEGIYEKGVWNGIGGIGVNFGDKRSRQIDFGMELTYKHGLSPVRTDFVKARHSVINLSLFVPVSLIADIAGGM